MATITHDKFLLKLESFAVSQLGSTKVSDAQAFVNIIGFAIDLDEKYEVFVGPDLTDDNARFLVSSLSRVLVGDGMLPENLTVGRINLDWFDGVIANRGEGKYYTGHFGGSSGFKTDFKNPVGSDSSQVAHAMAGIHIAFDYPGFVERDVRSREPHEEDKRLYDATYDIGNRLNNSNYKKLPEWVANELGTSMVKYVPDAYDHLL